MRGNAIYANGGLGIDLKYDGVTLNDLGDADTGPNNLQNFPLLTDVDFGAQTKIGGTLNSLPNAAYTLDFYANAVPGPSGYGEGQRYLGSTTVTTDATGNVAFSVTLTAASSSGEWITATATDAAGNTSEFSARAVPDKSFYAVTNTLDSGPGSLRQAIITANAAAAPVSISFNIPATDPGFVDDDATMLGGDPGPDVFVIKPLSSLPAINNPNYAIKIDGTTQTTFGGDTNPFGPEIVLNGSLAGIADGLDIYSANNTVEGLNIQTFYDYGICISAVRAGERDRRQLHRYRPHRHGRRGQQILWRQHLQYSEQHDRRNHRRHEISSREYSVGVRIYGAAASGNVIEGNYIGTNAAGTAAVANASQGVYLYNAPNNTIGGITAGARNVISGNSANPNPTSGIYIAGSTASGNVIEGNYIGTDATGTAAVANRSGVRVESPNNTIGGTTAGTRNVISGNWAGVLILGSTASGNVIEGNYIGTDATGTVAVANGDGVQIESASNNTIGGTAAGAANVISGNTSWGIGVGDAAAIGNAMRGNSIYSNGGLGIDLNCDGVTPNHVGSATGPNNLQNFPVLSDVVVGTQTKVGGSLNSLPNATYTLDFYANAAADPSGYGQGQRYLGSTSVTTDAAGNATFSVTLPSATASGEWISVTATDAGGNTSEFSSMPSGTPRPSRSRARW